MKTLHLGGFNSDLTKTRKAKSRPIREALQPSDNNHITSLIIDTFHNADALRYTQTRRPCRNNPL